MNFYSIFAEYFSTQLESKSMVVVVCNYDTVIGIQVRLRALDMGVWVSKNMCGVDEDESPLPSPPSSSLLASWRSHQSTSTFLRAIKCEVHGVDLSPKEQHPSLEHLFSNPSSRPSS